MLMATIFLYIYAMATSFFYIYNDIYIDIYNSFTNWTERPVVLLNVIFSNMFHPESKPGHSGPVLKNDNEKFNNKRKYVYIS